MMFIFASLLELAVIGYMSRNDGAPSRVKPRRQSHEPAAWSQISSPRPGLQKVSIGFLVRSMFGSDFGRHARVF
jgi:hypothetical protein